MKLRFSSILAACLLASGLVTPVDATGRRTARDPSLIPPPVLAVAWDIRVVSAPWLQAKKRHTMPQRSFDLWTDTASMDFGIHSGSFLSKASSLPVGKTSLLGEAAVSFPLNEPFTIESAQRTKKAARYTLDVSPQQDLTRPGQYRANVRLRLGGNQEFARGLSLRAHRGRIWLVPTKHELVAVVLTARPVSGTGQQPTPPAPRLGDVELDLVMVRSAWKGLATLRETDFATWLDPFDGELSERQLNTLLAPLSGSRVGPGEILLRHRSPASLGQLVTVDWGTAGASSDERKRARHWSEQDESLTLSLSARRHPDGPHQFKVVLSMERSSLGEPSMVSFRSFDTVAGEGHAWVVPTENHLLVVFTRARWRR